jgi:hypothetical protein
MPMGRRGVFAGLSFLLPAVLTLRVARQAFSKGRHLNRVALALPLVVLLETIWSVGELVGYVTGQTGGPERPQNEAFEAT